MHRSRRPALVFPVLLLSLPVTAGLLAGCEDGFSAPAGAKSGTGGDSGGVGGGGGGAGGETFCMPGETVPCYEGPPGTEGVGACVSGNRACDAQGSSFGNCLGDVLPTSERCDTTEDDDCDGVANPVEAGCQCEPGTLVPCYDGPSGTEGVGLCAAGTQVCEPSGLAYGTCDGEVVPVAEDCKNVVDDDCDGNACAAPRWGLMFGGVDADKATSVAVGSQAIVLGGATKGGLMIGSDTVISAGGYDALVVQLGADGVPAWARSFGDAGDQSVAAVAVDAGGQVVIAGTYTGTLKLSDSLSLTTQAPQSAFVARLDGGGKVTWGTTLGATGSTLARGVAVGPDGSVAVVGYINGSLSCNQFLCVSFASDIWVAVYEADGSTRFVKTFGDAASQDVLGVAVDSAGNIVLGGSAQGVLDLGGVALNLPAAGSPQAWVGRLDASGDGAWIKTLGKSGSSWISHVGRDPLGNVLVAGTFGGQLDFGNLGKPNALGISDAFVAALSPAGTVLWQRTVGESLKSTQSDGVAARPGGDTVWGVSSSGVLDFGQGACGGQGQYDSFIAVLDATGKARWSKAFGEAATQQTAAVGAAPDGDVVVLANAFGSIDVGTGLLVSAGMEDLVAARFAP